VEVIHAHEVCRTGRRHGEIEWVCRNVARFDASECEYGFAATSIEVGTVLKGDLSPDGVLDMMDAFAIFSAVSTGSDLTDAQKAAADMNGDSVIDMLDAFALYRIVSGA